MVAPKEVTAPRRNPRRKRKRPGESSTSLHANQRKPTLPDKTYTGRGFKAPASIMDPITLEADLIGFGIVAANVKRLMASQEPAVDELGQLPHGRFGRARQQHEAACARHLRDIERSRGQKRYEDFDPAWAVSENRKNKKSASGRQNLYLRECSNWVLFDPLRGWPPTLIDPPEILERYSHFDPGNKKVLEYNPVSDSFRLKATPDILDGCTVEYTRTGPRIVRLERTDSIQNGNLNETEAQPRPATS